MHFLFAVFILLRQRRRSSASPGFGMRRVAGAGAVFELFKMIPRRNGNLDAKE